MNRIILFSIMLLSILPLFSQTTFLVGSPWVYPEIEFDFGYITDAVEAAEDGDTIIVYPGVYGYINFYGKNVCITSLYRYTNDRNDIYNTIIDRDNMGGSAVIIATNENRGAVLDGFTIQNGIGEQTQLPGSPLVREGGGIFIRNASPTILNCIIQDNTAYYRGGGIAISSTSAFISPYLAGNIIKNNSCAIGQGGGIIIGTSNLYQIEVIFDPDNKNSIFLNDAQEYKDIYSMTLTYTNVVLDTFTVATADPLYIDMYGDYDFSCDHWKINQDDHDLYVSVTGDDTNTGTSPDSPLKTINEAMLRINSNPDNRNTIHVAPGVYKASEGQIFPILIKSDVILQGAGQDATVFDLEEGTGAIHSTASSKRFKISGIAIINGRANSQMYGKMSPIVLSGTDNGEISDCHFENNHLGIGTDLWSIPSRTEPIYFKNLSFIDNVNQVIDLNLENAIFENIKILNHHSADIVPLMYSFGLPVHINTLYNARGNYTFTNVLIANIEYPTVMVVGDNLDVLINNATIVNTMSILPKEYSAYNVIAIGRDSVVKAYNSIFYNVNGYITGYSSESATPSTFHLDHSFLLGGPSMVLCALVWGEGNIDGYPEFDWGYLGVEDWPFQLTSTSPCINAGTVNIPEYTWLAGDIMGNTRIIGDTVDMGAYEFGGDNAYLVDFVGDPRTGVIPLTVQFIDTSVGYEISSWQWDFNNDGVFDSTEQNPSFTYYTTGHHTVRLVINNGQASRVKPEYINPRPDEVIGGTLQGIVTADGYPLPDVLVTVLGTTLNALTNEMGMYVITGIEAGTYSVSAFKDDYEPSTHSGVVINIDEVTIRHFVLSPLSESDDVSVAVATVLWGNYPNPFNPSTVIAFDLGRAGEVVIEVYNIKGAKVKTLVNGVFGAGRHSVVWDGCADDGRSVGSGVYFYRMGAGGYVSVRKMLLVK